RAGPGADPRAVRLPLPRARRLSGPRSAPLGAQELHPVSLIEAVRPARPERVALQGVAVPPAAAAAPPPALRAFISFSICCCRPRVTSRTLLQLSRSFLMRLISVSMATTRSRRAGAPSSPDPQSCHPRKRPAANRIASTTPAWVYHQTASLTWVAADLSSSM